MRFMAHGTIENRTAVDGFLMGQRAQLHCVFETNRREKMMKELIAMFMTLCCSLVLSSCNIPSARRRFFTYPMKEILNDNIDSIYAMIDSLSEEELFKPHMRKWADEATKTAVWEVYKFIHVNTVAPFGTFRTKIRKWKKIAL